MWGTVWFLASGSTDSACSETQHPVSWSLPSSSSWTFLLSFLLHLVQLAGDLALYIIVRQFTSLAEWMKDPTPIRATASHPTHVKVVAIG